MGNKAKYYKCALQVNPYSYAKYRGDVQIDEQLYNQEIVKYCKSNDISVVGLADHGSVDSSNSLREALQESGIVVFPGFEISSAEKIHMVCLFPPSYDSSKLNRIIGCLGLSLVEQGTEVSTETCLSIADKVSDNGGFWYAAHITGDNGILKIGKMQHIWSDNRLIAAQIPAGEDEVDPVYKNIINNTDPNYKRSQSVAYINASDIEKPEDLCKENASVLIKMSEPNFDNFCMAFKDPESRIRLNSEKENNFQSSINYIKISGGYLDGLNLELTENLGTIIGGRGTGKSTLIGAIRYALQKEPISKDAKTDFNNMIAQNLGSASIVELSVTSNLQHGQKFVIKRRFKQNPVITKEDGSISPLTISDILPTIEIYGQNEIMEIARDELKIKDVAERLLPISKEMHDNMTESFNELKKNNEEITKEEKLFNTIKNSLEELPSIEEKLSYYAEAGLDTKLDIFRRLSSEEGQFNAIEKSLNIDKIDFPKIDVGDYENEELKELANKIIAFNKSVQQISDKYYELIGELKESFETHKQNWEIGKTKYDNQLKEALKTMVGIQDMSSQQIVNEYTSLIRQSEECKPLADKRKDLEQKINDLQIKRKTIIEKYKSACDERDRHLKTSIKKINKNKLSGIVRIDIKPRQNKKKIIDYLTSHINGVGEKSLGGIESYDDFDIFTFTDDCRKGVNHLKGKYNLTNSVSEKIINEFTESNLREMEEIQLEDIIEIELFVNDKYKKLKDLSKGQQCTAILNLLLIDNKDPLIIDQPEDNLDNSFIAENLVKTLRENKIKRQYLLATHNANIPVFGDAEQIITMEENEGNGSIAPDGLGSIDDTTVKDKVISILEGGRFAFKMREEKYGLH